jgi:hypothetical protein
MAITEGRRLDVRAIAPHRGVSERRKQFDKHIDDCTDCQPVLCSTAQAMWRGLCLAALRATPGGA